MTATCQLQPDLHAFPQDLCQKRKHREEGRALKKRALEPGPGAGPVLYENAPGVLHRMRDGRCHRVVVEAGALAQRGMFRRCDALGRPVPRPRLSKKLRRLMRTALSCADEAEGHEGTAAAAVALRRRPARPRGGAAVLPGAEA